jgi:hypothetical protein
MKKTLLASTLILLLSASTCFSIGYSKCIVSQSSLGTDSRSLKTWEDDYTIVQGGSVQINVWLSDVSEPRFIDNGDGILYRPCLGVGYALRLRKPRWS